MCFRLIRFCERRTSTQLANSELAEHWRYHSCCPVEYLDRAIWPNNWYVLESN